MVAGSREHKGAFLVFCFMLEDMKVFFLNFRLCNTVKFIVATIFSPLGLSLQTPWHRCVIS
jgi:hypothetical protein